MSCKYRVLANGIPKAGTNLLLNCLSQFEELNYKGINLQFEQPGELINIFSQLDAGSFISSHIFPTNTNVNLIKQFNFKTILIIRDPRDVVISWVNYVTKKVYNRYTDFLNNLENDDERIKSAITGISKNDCQLRIGIEDIGTLFREYLKWSSFDNNLIVRYENLIGEDGDGLKDRQIYEVLKIANHLDLKISPEQTNHIVDNTFNRNSLTFRNGKIGDWKENLNDSNRNLFKDIAGELLIELGYEKNFDW
jgi:hypothetical protein